MQRARLHAGSARGAMLICDGAKVARADSARQYAGRASWRGSACGTLVAPRGSVQARPIRFARALSRAMAVRLGPSSIGVGGCDGYCMRIPHNHLRVCSDVAESPIRKVVGVLAGGIRGSLAVSAAAVLAVESAAASHLAHELITRSEHELIGRAAAPRLSTWTANTQEAPCDCSHTTRQAASRVPHTTY